MDSTADFSCFSLFWISVVFLFFEELTQWAQECSGTEAGNMANGVIRPIYL